jgi:hypothetical protein
MDVKADSPTYLLPEPDGHFLDRIFGGDLTFIGDGDRPASELRWNVGPVFTAPRATAAR